MKDFIEIDGKKYPLKYGYGAIALLGEKWDLDGYEAVIDKLVKLFPDGKEIQLKFTVLEAIGDLVLAGVINAGGNVAKEDIITQVLATPAILSDVFALFMSKLPKANPVETKKKAIPKKQLPKKANP